MSLGPSPHRRLASLLDRLVLAGMLLTMACAGTRPAAGVDALVISPTAPVQGDTIAIIIHAVPGSSVTVRFNGTPLPVFSAAEGTWRALRGTDPDTAPGSYPAVATIAPPGSAAVTVRRTVRIAPTRFAERHLTLPPKTMGLITPKNLAIEAAALNAVLGRHTPEAFWHGPFHMPVTGPVDSPYGYQGFYNGRREWWHQGVDFDVPDGAPVTAPNGAVVALARALPLGGNTVVLDHGQGVLTEYLHLSSFAVHEGERVGQGDLIARIGATGLVTGPSLHWGLYASGHWVNPLFWTTARPGLTE